MVAYKLSKKAQSDVDDITVYTALHFGEEQAVNYTDNIHDAARLATHFPNLGRQYTTIKGSVYRQYNVGRHALFYQPIEGGIFIVRILHQMMDFDRHLE